MTHELYMQRCLDLAKNGIGNVAPNPMVGAVIVYQNKIIGEGFHQEFGKSHAEVNAINSVKDKSLLEKSTLYVSLEPCCHFGKTDPCTDLIIKSKIKKVVIGSIDPNPNVNEKGIKILRNAGIDIKIKVLEKESIFLNRRFYTFNIKKRPYIILKWAQSTDNFIDVNRNSILQKPYYFLDNFGKFLVHKMRAEETAILIGKNTVILDNPELSCRNYFGKNPTRIIIDNNLELKESFNIFNNSVSTIIFNSKKDKIKDNISFIKINFNDNILYQILNKLFLLKILSIIIEGGSITLSQFIENNLWDEAYVFINNSLLKNGVSAPQINKKEYNIKKINNYLLKTFYNNEYKN